MYENLTDNVHLYVDFLETYDAQCAIDQISFLDRLVYETDEELVYFIPTDSFDEIWKLYAHIGKVLQLWSNKTGMDPLVLKPETVTTELGWSCPVSKEYHPFFKWATLE